MNNWKLALTVLPIAAAAACHDVDGPLARSLEPPRRASLTGATGPDTTFFIYAPSGSVVPLMNFPYPTYVTLEGSGTFLLSAEPLLPPGTQQYVPQQTVPITGVSDPRRGCALDVSVWYGGSKVDSFGDCHVTPKLDTLRMDNSPTWQIKRGTMPDDRPGDCNATGTGCHSVNPFDYQLVRERAIPVKLNKPRPSQRTANFKSINSVQVTFYVKKTPDSLIIRGVQTAHPLSVTFWQWIGADSTRETTPARSSCPSPNLLYCEYIIREAGRMVLKAFTGGYEQVTSSTVQCIMPPADTILDDAKGDFSLREALRDALDRSNPDSAPGAGATALHRGYRHEEGGVIWRLPDSSYLAIRMDDFAATECHYNPTVGPPPVPGAIPVAVYHTHPSNPGDDVYGCGKDSNGVKTRDYPGGPGVLPTMDDPREAGGGSGWQRGATKGDWPYADNNDVPVFILQKDGTAWRLTPHFPGPKKNNPYHWTAFGKAFDPANPAGKCTWPKSYYPS